MSKPERPTKIHVHHILVQHQFEAEDLRRKIHLGSDFAELARKYSLCPSGQKGGDLGEMALSRLNVDFVEAALKLNVSEISPPVRTRFGWHLIERIN